MQYFVVVVVVTTIENQCAPLALVVLGVSIACNGVSTKKRALPNTRE